MSVKSFIVDSVAFRFSALAMYKLDQYGASIIWWFMYKTYLIVAKNNRRLTMNRNQEIMKMTEFDKILNIKLHDFKTRSGKSFKTIADELGIPANRLYRFTSKERALNGEDTRKLMNYLNLTVELKEKTQ